MVDGKLPATLIEAAITSLPESAYYIPNFISPAKEKLILDKVHALFLLLQPLTYYMLTVRRSMRRPSQPGVIFLTVGFRHTLLL